MQLNVEDVTVIFGSRRILDGVSFTAVAGEPVAVVGPSGSGKSTLLSVIAGLLRPDAGGVRFGGDASGHHRLALVQQTTNALGRRSAIENVALGAQARGLDHGSALEIAGQVLQDVGIGHRAHTQARRLSGGELQRLAIARAAAVGATLLVADEPTGQLDATTSRQVEAVLLDVLAPECVMVIATHDREFARRCDRVIEIIDGVIR